MVPKGHCGIELGNDLPVPAMPESHEMPDPLLISSSYDFIKYGIVLPSHIIPIHILSLMSDLGLFSG
jgi:hypothetical protein